MVKVVERRQFHLICRFRVGGHFLSVMVEITEKWFRLSSACVKIRSAAENCVLSSNNTTDNIMHSSSRRGHVTEDILYVLYMLFVCSSQRGHRVFRIKAQRFNSLYPLNQCILSPALKSASIHLLKRSSFRQKLKPTDQTQDTEVKEQHWSCEAREVFMCPSNIHLLPASPGNEHHYYKSLIQCLTPA